VDSDNPRGPRRDHFLDAGRVQGVRLRIDVGEDRRDFLPLQSVRGGDEGEGGNDHFAAQVQGPDSDFQGQGAVAGRDTVAHVQQVGHALLELTDVGTAVGEPTAVEDVVEAVVELLPVADIGGTDMHRLVKGG